MKYYLIVLKISVILAVASCTGMDEYLKYTDNKELVYSGKVDSAFVYGGRNRVLIRGLLMSDPKIVKVTAYWNMQAEKVELNIERSAGVDEIKLPINLPEGRYNFDLITCDKDGNSSVPVQVSGASYGSRYEEALPNRPVKSVTKEGDKVIVTFYTAAEEIVFTEITFTDSNEKSQVLKVPNNTQTADLPNIKDKSKFTYQTFYKPEKKAIDIFSAKAETAETP